MAVLCDWQIEALAKISGLVDPFIKDNLQPASLDLRLSNEFIVFENHNQKFIDLASVEDNGVVHKNVSFDDGFVLHPGEFVLGATEEYVRIPSVLVARLEGKSSIGRLGILVHVTAGYIDPGFQGRITLEIYNLRNIPILLRPGLPFCQISFYEMSEEPEKTYSGRYQGDMNVQSSRYGKAISDGT